MTKQQTQNPHHVGDKVRIRKGQDIGQRGQIESVEVEHLLIRSGDTIHRLPEDYVTNYSLAARRAWESMPKRAGRPSSDSPKKMVSIRIDSDLWERLEVAALNGLITSRQQAINEWVKERLEQLENRNKT